MTATEPAISFKDPLVLAIEAGVKTVTRRLVTDAAGDVPPADAVFREWHGAIACFDTDMAGPGMHWTARCRYPVGCRPWVKQRLVKDDWGVVTYGSDRARLLDSDGGPVVWPWKPLTLGAMYCPRWASRLTLEVLTVRVERLQDITEADAIAEGAQRFDDIPLDPVHERHPEHADRWSMDAAPPTTGHCLGTARFAFANLWDRINGKTPGAPGSAIGS